MALYANDKLVIFKDADALVQGIDPCKQNNEVINFNTTAKATDAEKTSKTVSINGKPACNIDSYFSKTYGAESADQGVKSGKKPGGKAEFIEGSADVFIDDQAAVRHGDKMVLNDKNTEPFAVQVLMPMDFYDKSE